MREINSLTYSGKGTYSTGGEYSLIWATWICVAPKLRLGHEYGCFNWVCFSEEATLSGHEYDGKNRSFLSLIE